MSRYVIISSHGHDTVATFRNTELDFTNCIDSICNYTHNDTTENSLEEDVYAYLHEDKIPK